jgi:branched-chain amino acid transport system substrate-binding protein
MTPTKRPATRVGLFVAGALAAASLAACGSGGSNSSSSDEILLGFPVALTGPSAAYGKPQATAAQMTVDAINKAGGVKELGGKKVKLLVEDTKSDPATATKIIREMARKGVSVLVGPGPSKEVVAAKPLIESLKIPAITSAVDPTVTDNAKYVFRTLPAVTSATAKSVEYLKGLIEGGTYPDIKKVGILMLNQSPGPAQLPILKKGIEDLGLSTTVVEYDPSQVKDFAPLVAKFKDEGVDIIVGNQYPQDAILFAQAVAGQSWRPRDGFFFVGAPIYQDAYRKAVGDDVVGWTGYAYYSNADTDYYPAESRELAKAFLAKTGQSLDQSSGASGASAVALAIDGIAAAKSTDPKKIAAAMHDDLNFTDPTGSAYPYYTTPGGVDFDENGNNLNVKSPVVQLLKGGTLAYVYPTELASADLVPYSQIK